jgi:hypothetical protein
MRSPWGSFCPIGSNCKISKNFKLNIIYTSQMKKCRLMNLEKRPFVIGGHPDLEIDASHHSCGTALGLHQTFPVSSNGCYPLEPIDSLIIVGHKPKKEKGGAKRCLSLFWVYCTTKIVLRLSSLAPLITPPDRKIACNISTTSNVISSPIQTRGIPGG